MAKLSSGDDISKELHAFVSGANVQVVPESEVQPKRTPRTPVKNREVKKCDPWEDPGLREDVIKHFNLRLNEITWAKLLFIFEHSKGSRHSVILDMLETEMGRRIEGIKKEKGTA